MEAISLLMRNRSEMNELVFARIRDITDFGDREKLLVLRPTNEGTHTYRINVQDNSPKGAKFIIELPVV